MTRKQSAPPATTSSAPTTHITRDRVPYRELGANWLARRHTPEHRDPRLTRQLERLGYTVTLEAAA